MCFAVPVCTSLPDVPHLPDPPFCSQAQAPRSRWTQTLKFSWRPGMFPWTKVVSVLQGFERGSILLVVHDAFVTEMFNALEMQTSSGDSRHAWLLLMYFTQDRVPVVCLRGIHSRSMLINPVLQDRTRTRGISTILYCTPEEFPRRNTYWLY